MKGHARPWSWRRLLPALGLAAFLGAAAESHAQPALNPGALDALNPTPPVRPHHSVPTRRPPAHAPAARPAAPKPEAPPPPPVAAAPALPKLPTVPAAPPALSAIPPAVAVPTQRPADPPPIPVAADAPGEVSALPNGVRVTFGANRADLNAATEAAIRGFARPLRQTEGAVNVLAYAAGSADDPSTPRRLSLSRALAARAVLINEGIVSTRIYVRALGAPGGDGPPDRVDLGVASPGGGPVAASSPSGTPGGARP